MIIAIIFLTPEYLAQFWKIIHIKTFQIDSQLVKYTNDIVFIKRFNIWQWYWILYLKIISEISHQSLVYSQ